MLTRNVSHMKKFIFVSTVIVLGSALFWLVSNSRAGTPTIEYKVVRTDGKFEIRDYPELRLATTAMKDGEMDSGFMELFRFISGENETKQKIEMTTPVLIDRATEHNTMSFVLPKEIASGRAPAPTGKNVRLTQVGATRFAAVRFSGGRSAENEQSALEALRTWAKEGKIGLRGEPMFAYYDPPWTPTFMRRNEAMLRVDGDTK